MLALTHTKKFDLLVLFPHEIRKDVEVGEIYEVIYEDVGFIVKTLWETKMSGVPVYFCAVLGDRGEIHYPGLAILSVDRFGKPLSKSEKEYYDLFM